LVEFDRAISTTNSKTRQTTKYAKLHGPCRALWFRTGRGVFGAAERMRFPGPDETVAHAEIVIGDSVIIIEDASPYMGIKTPPADGLDGSPAFLYIYVQDVDAVRERRRQWHSTRASCCRSLDGWKSSKPNGPRLIPPLSNGAISSWRHDVEGALQLIRHLDQESQWPGVCALHTPSKVGSSQISLRCTFSGENAGMHTAT
jgi:hypothetical protein